MSEESRSNRKPVQKNTRTSNRKEETPGRGPAKKFREEKSDNDRPRREGPTKRYPSQDRNSDRPERNYRDEKSDDQRPRREGPAKRYPSQDRNSDRPERNYRDEKSDDQRPRREGPAKRYPSQDRNSDRPERNYRDKRSDDQKPRREGPAKRYPVSDRNSDQPVRNYGDERSDDQKPRRDGPAKRYPSQDRNSDRPARKFRDEKSENQKPRREGTESKHPLKDRKSERPAGRGRKKPALSLTNYDTLRLNKYISNAGICSRREADELIKTGLVEVDGKAITEMGYKVKPGEVVRYAGEKITPEKPVYFLLNKPKDYSSEMKLTTDRKSALTLLKGIGKHSVAPIGKLGRSSTGLVLYTNDGEIAGKLANPKGGIKKIYHVFLDKNLRKEDLDAILEGVEVEGAIIKADDISYVGTAKDKKQLGIELRNNRNKAVRTLFKQLGYYVVKLDRVMYAGLTKKDLPRGKWRPLTDQELVNLKMLK